MAAHDIAFIFEVWRSGSAPAWGAGGRWFDPSHLDERAVGNRSKWYGCRMTTATIVFFIVIQGLLVYLMAMDGVRPSRLR